MRAREIVMRFSVLGPCTLIALATAGCGGSGDGMPSLCIEARAVWDNEYNSGTWKSKDAYEKGRRALSEFISGQVSSRGIENVLECAIACSDDEDKIADGVYCGVLRDCLVTSVLRLGSSEQQVCVISAIGPSSIGQMPAEFAIVAELGPAGLIILFDAADAAKPTQRHALLEAIGRAVPTCVDADADVMTACARQWLSIKYSTAQVNPDYLALLQDYQNGNGEMPRLFIGNP